MSRHFLPVTFLALIASNAALAAPPRGSRLAPPQSRLISGNELYRSYCASCHGLQGKGDGPAAVALRMRPTDLTLLTRANRGVFPQARLQKILGGSDLVTAHGGRQMPVWGPSLAAPGATDARTAERVRDLISYIESIQAKSK